MMVSMMVPVLFGVVAMMAFVVVGVGDDEKDSEDQSGLHVGSISVKTVGCPRIVQYSKKVGN